MKNKPLSPDAIGAKIRLGKDFTVKTKKERALALFAARFAGAKVTSRAIPKKGFQIFFI